MSTHYKPFNGGGWEFGEKLPGRDEWHVYLGPCPVCGTACYNYGGGWRCMALYCSNNVNNSIGNLGIMPDWWNTGVQVKLDGSSWCAHNEDFINIMESPVGFGITPKDAVDALRTVIKQLEING